MRGAAHVQPLLATLASRQPALRRAAADTLRHLAERYSILGELFHTHLRLTAFCCIVIRAKCYCLVICWTRTGPAAWMFSIMSDDQASGTAARCQQGVTCDSTSALGLVEADVRADCCRDPQADYWQGVEGPLFVALDAENVAAIAGQIRATLQTLLRASAPHQPSRWLAACSAIVLASGPAIAAQPSGDAPGAEASHPWSSIAIQVYGP